MGTQMVFGINQAFARGLKSPLHSVKGVLRLPKARSLVGSKRPSRGRSRTFLRNGGNVWASKSTTPERLQLLGLQWPACHLKQLWMLQLGAAHKPLRSSTLRISLLQRDDLVEQAWKRLAQRLENKNRSFHSFFRRWYSASNASR